MWFCKKELTLINLLKLDIFLKYKGNFRKSEEFPAIGRRLLRFLHRNDSDGEYIRCPRCLPPASSPPRRPLIDAPPGLSISFLPFWLFYPSSWELHNLILCALTTMQRSGMPGKVRFRAELSPQEEPEPPPKPSALGVPTSTLRAGLGALGFLETAYLTYVKFTGAEAFCPVGGGSCGGVLNSDYSFIFGRLLIRLHFLVARWIFLLVVFDRRQKLDEIGGLDCAQRIMHAQSYFDLLPLPSLLATCDLIYVFRFS